MGGAFVRAVEECGVDVFARCEHAAASDLWAVEFLHVERTIPDRDAGPLAEVAKANFNFLRVHVFESPKELNQTSQRTRTWLRGFRKGKRVGAHQGPGSLALVFGGKASRSSCCIPAARFRQRALRSPFQS